jgi:hypothetical protein
MARNSQAKNAPGAIASEAMPGLSMVPVRLDAAQWAAAMTPIARSAVG